MAELRREASERRGAARRRPVSPNGDAPAAERHPLVHLGTRVGNAAVARLFAQRAAPETPDEDDTLEPVQAQREAEPVGPAASEVGLDGGTLSEATSSRVRALRGAGSALDARLRVGMEAAFGTSFGDVRVHTTPEADALNRRLGARAFTSGTDIALRGDQSAADPRLLAHELTHVVQQRAMGGGPQASMEVGPAEDAQERQADAVAGEVVARLAAADGGAGPGAAPEETDPEAL